MTHNLVFLLECGYRKIWNTSLYDMFQMDVKLALCQMIGQSTGMGNDLHELNEKDIVHKQKLCMEILNVANIISPGGPRVP